MYGVSTGVESTYVDNQLRPLLLCCYPPFVNLRQLSRSVSRSLPKRRVEMVSAHEKVSAANMIWVLGSARTGSTYLAKMLEHAGFLFWDEPLFGELFGPIRAQKSRYKSAKKRQDFALYENNDYPAAIRQFILTTALMRFPKIRLEDMIVVKEPHANASAPLLMEALPESRMLWLMRDPRDVIASGLDARTGWAVEHKTQVERERAANADGDKVARQRAAMYQRDMEAASEAYEAHRGPKSLLRYEDLRVEPIRALSQTLTELDMHIPQHKVERAVVTESWESTPASQKGVGKGKRSATPGGWREDLTPKQVQIVEEVTQPFIERFYS